jgi:hypothetical protein
LNIVAVSFAVIHQETQRAAIFVDGGLPEYSDKVQRTAIFVASVCKEDFSMVGIPRRRAPQYL